MALNPFGKILRTRTAGNGYSELRRDWQIDSGKIWCVMVRAVCFAIMFMRSRRFWRSLAMIYFRVKPSCLPLKSQSLDNHWLLPIRKLTVMKFVDLCSVYASRKTSSVCGHVVHNWSIRGCNSKLGNFCLTFLLWLLFMYCLHRDAIKRVLGLLDTHVLMEYKAHRDAMQDHSSFRNTDKFSWCFLSIRT